jgi:uncharacterized protein YaiI (UPF0178 family)
MAEGQLTRAEDIIWRKIDDEIVIIKDDGLAVHVLNKTAARIWEMCGGDFGPDEIAAKLCERYEVSLEKASTDVRNTVAKMMAKGLLKCPD